jgi:hypothetical protein
LVAEQPSPAFLSLPIDPTFASKPPQLSLSELQRWCEEMMSLFNYKDNPAKRREQMCSVEFVL